LCVCNAKNPKQRWVQQLVTNEIKLIFLFGYIKSKGMSYQHYCPKIPYTVEAT
jgi:hypothetical protein